MIIKYIKLFLLTNIQRICNINNACYLFHWYKYNLSILKNKQMNQAMHKMTWVELTRKNTFCVCGYYYISEGIYPHIAIIHETWNQKKDFYNKNQMDVTNITLCTHIVMHFTRSDMCVNADTIILPLAILWNCFI